MKKPVSLKRILIATSVGLIVLWPGFRLVQQYRLRRCCEAIRSPDPKVSQKGISKALGFDNSVGPDRKVTKAILDALPRLAPSRQDYILMWLSYASCRALRPEDVPVFVNYLESPRYKEPGARYKVALMLSSLGRDAEAALPVLERLAREDREAGGPEAEIFEEAARSIREDLEESSASD